MTAKEIAVFARNAGWNQYDLITAVAIALAESSGNPNAHGDLKLGGGSFGLWQIYSGAHPEYGPDFAKLYDPQTNANAAYEAWCAAGRRFTPWSTFISGAYAHFLNTVNEALEGK